MRDFIRMHFAVILITAISVLSSTCKAQDDRDRFKQAVAEEPFSLLPRSGDVFSAMQNVRSSDLGPSDAYWGSVQLFIWGDTKSLRLLWWESRDSSVRRYILTLIFIGMTDDELENAIVEFTRFSGRFNKTESIQRHGEIKSAFGMIKSVAKIVLENSKFHQNASMPANVKLRLEHFISSNLKDQVTNSISPSEK